MNSRKAFWFGLVLPLSLGLYLILARRYPISPSLENPRASWASMVEPTIGNAALHIAIYLGLTLLYMAALHLLLPPGKAEVHPRWQIVLIIGTWLACSGVLMATAPAGESHDIFDYIFRGRMMTEYQANPLIDVPDDFELSIPYTRYLAWRDNVDTYGPVWEASSAAIAVTVRQVAHWSGWWDETYLVCPKSPESCRLLVAYITGYRLFAIILTGFSGRLIYDIAKHNQPSLAPLAFAAWLLNPMTLVATALGGHNDAVMLVLVLLCWWLLQRHRLFLALLTLVLAAHIKLTALIWMPVCVLWIFRSWGWKRTLKVGLASAASGLALSWLLYAPFDGWGSLPRMLQERSQFLANSFWSVLKYWLTNFWDWPTGSALQLSTVLPSWLFAIGALLFTLWNFNFRPKRWHDASIASVEGSRVLWHAMRDVSMLYLLVGSFWFQHWYFLWVLVPAVLLPDSRFSRWILPWLAFGALSSNVTMDFLLNSVLEGSQSIMKHILPVVMIWGPVTLAAIVFRLTQNKRPEKDSLTASNPIVQN
jgi:Gpi18-like mannosyltransferase